MGVRGGFLAALLLLAVMPAPASQDFILRIDDFGTIDAWSAHPADGVALALAADEGALRMDFDIPGGGWAIARRELDLNLPADYVISFRVRGAAKPNHLEFKLVDASGENVWWHVRRDFVFTEEWQTIRIKKRQLAFAWGPQGGGELQRAAALEIAITAGQGGSGSVWIDDLTLKPRLPATEPPPAPWATASSEGAAAVLDGDPATTWAPDTGDADPWLRIDLRRETEFSGLTLDWGPGHSRAYTIEGSLDGKRWQPLVAVTAGDGGRDSHFLPESEARYLRLRFAGNSGRPSLAELRVEPLSWAATRNDYYRQLAAAAPRGSFPRGMAGEQSYWTVVGPDADPRECLISEDGMVETPLGAPAIEPFLWTGERLLTWADVELTQSLAGGGLPIPSVRWTAGDPPLALTITAFPVGEPGAAGVVLRYRVENLGDRRCPVTLYLALRPFQVNPPTQLLNRSGGFAPLRALTLQSDRVLAEGETRIRLLTPPTAMGALAAEPGALIDSHLRHRSLPDAGSVVDSSAAAAGVLAYPMQLEPGAASEVIVALPLDATMPLPPAGADPAAWAAAALAEAESAWAARLNVLQLELPPPAARLAETFRAQLGYILVNRAGPAIQPGSRAYARSWIRDGALTASALLRAGLPEVARDFCDWYAPHQYDSGKIPCVVDWRGADPVPEHDSSGEFIFLVAECARYGGGADFARRHWPRVAAAAAYLDSLRGERRGEEWLAPERREFYGLLPPSISHEGYSAKPMHSYWDDLWALRGFRDAAWLAESLGEAESARRWRQVAAEFAGDLHASVLATQARHGIDYMPGCADLGDFDPTSTTIALTPVQAGAALPAAAVRRSFERFLDFFRERRDGRADWDAYTPYELRTVGAYVHLGWREEAQELLDFYLADQRPAGWRHWAEVVGREPREARFLGDMPHTWVGSDFLRSVLDMLLFVDERRDALVLGAGVPAAWLASGPVGAGPLPVPGGGALRFRMAVQGDAVEIAVEGDCRVPPGGILLSPPEASAYRSAEAGGAPLARLPSGEIVLRALPARVLLRR